MTWQRTSGRCEGCVPSSKPTRGQVAIQRAGHSKGWNRGVTGGLAASGCSVSMLLAIAALGYGMGPGSPPKRWPGALSMLALEDDGKLFLRSATCLDDEGCRASLACPASGHGRTTATYCMNGRPLTTMPQPSALDRFRGTAAYRKQRAVVEKSSRISSVITCSEQLANSPGGPGKASLLQLGRRLQPR